MLKNFLYSEEDYYNAIILDDFMTSGTTLKFALNLVPDSVGAVLFKLEDSKFK